MNLCVTYKAALEVLRKVLWSRPDDGSAQTSSEASQVLCAVVLVFACRGLQRTQS